MRRSTAERPSRLRVCSCLNQNALTGSVPSSLSALINLEELCVPPFLPTAFAGAAEEGRIGRHCSEQRGMSGDACRGHRGGAMRQQGCRQCSRRRPRGMRCDYGVLQGHPILWVRCAGTVGAHGCCGCGVAPPERPSPLRVCSLLINDELTGSVPSSLSTLTNLQELCVPPCCRARGVSGNACRAHRRGRCGSRAVAVLSEGTSGTPAM